MDAMTSRRDRIRFIRGMASPPLLDHAPTDVRSSSLVNTVVSEVSALKRNHATSSAVNRNPHQNSLGTQGMVNKEMALVLKTSPAKVPAMQHRGHT